MGDKSRRFMHLMIFPGVIRKMVSELVNLDIICHTVSYTLFTTVLSTDGVRGR